MGLFDNLNTEGLEKAEDRIGGGPKLFDADIYLATVKLAYAGASAGGARNITLVLGINDEEYRETIYITNKQGENFFRNKADDTKKIPLPGFSIVNDLCIVTTDKQLFQQDTDEKVVKVYDFEKREEVPTNVHMLVELIGKEAYVALSRTLSNKNKKNDSTNEYEPTPETREENNIVKVFHNPTKFTVVEATNQEKEPVFFDEWLKKYKGTVTDKRTIKDGASSQGGRNGRPGGGPPQASEGGAKKTPSLFQN